MFLGSPGPMPGASLPLRVFVRTPRLVEFDSELPGWPQFTRLNRLKVSSRTWNDVPSVNLVVLNTDTSNALKPGP